MSRQIQARRALLRLALVVFPVASFGHPAKTTHFILALPPPGLRPYLKVTMPPPLRFHEPKPPSDLTKPVALDIPPLAADGLKPGEAELKIVAPPEPTIVETPSEPVEQPEEIPVESTPAPAPILTDETRIPMRIEDFLPYFEAPSQAPRAAQPASHPPSSATYRQQ